MSYLSNRVAGFGTTIFTEMTALAREHNAVNLGQGFPDFPAPDFIKEAAAKAISADINQYAPLPGSPRLRQAIADKTKRLYGREVDPNTQVQIVNGATEAIYATIQGVVNPGDEVIMFEPYYDSYVPCTTMAGGIPRYYTLRAPDWHIDRDELAKLFNDKTKLLIINTPHNPIGKVYTREELQMIADLCIEHDVLVMADEVYEHIVFDDAEHVQIASLPGMEERTITVSSIGKSFSVTGWKIGWTVTTPELNKAVFKAHQFIAFAVASPLQEASADALFHAEESDYYPWLAKMYQDKRDYLLSALNDAGFKTLTPQGAYYILLDISEMGRGNDVDFCRYLTKEVGVAAIPPSAFYSNPADGATIARLTFCKTDEMLAAAAERLQTLK